MHTENVIWMQAPPERVFELAADIERWPELLPHYRWVRVLEQRPGERLAEMAAHRAHFPVKWTSIQRLLPSEGRIIYHHVRGVTAGMEVEWRVAPHDGGAHVTILHDLKPSNWLLKSRLAAWIVGDFFVKGIADRTLHHIKLAAEGNAR